MPVHFLCPVNFALRPQFVGNERDGRITVHLAGPAGEEPPAVVAFIDLTRRHLSPACTRTSRYSYNYRKISGCPKPRPAPRRSSFLSFSRTYPRDEPGERQSLMIVGVG